MTLLKYCSLLTHGTTAISFLILYDNNIMIMCSQVYIDVETYISSRSDGGKRCR